MTSGSDVVEVQDYGPPGDGYPMVAQSGLLIENDPPEAAWSPSQKLEDAVARVQRDITDYRKELRIAGGQGPAIPGRWLGRRYGGPAAAFPSGWRCSQCRLADARVPAGGTGSFDELPVGTLRFSGAVS